MKFILNDENLIIEELGENELIVSGTINYYKAKVEYNDTWKNLNIVAKLIKHNELVGIEKPVLLNSISYDVNLDGTYLIGFVGYDLNENNEKTYQISTPLKPIIFTKGAGQIKTANKVVPSASEWELYIAQIQEMLKNNGGSGTGGGAIDDVRVDGVSVVENRIANIDLRQRVIDILIEYDLLRLDELSEEQIQALNEMTCEIDENGELVISYDEEILPISFALESANLVVTSNINALFGINTNGELEVSYESN